jgi:hypothetical protein
MSTNAARAAPFEKRQGFDMSPGRLPCLKANHGASFTRANNIQRSVFYVTTTARRRTRLRGDQEGAITAKSESTTAKSE